MSKQDLYRYLSSFSNEKYLKILNAIYKSTNDSKILYFKKNFFINFNKLPNDCIYTILLFIDKIEDIILFQFINKQFNFIINDLIFSHFYFKIKKSIRSKHIKKYCKHECKYTSKHNFEDIIYIQYSSTKLSNLNNLYEYKYNDNYYLYSKYKLQEDIFNKFNLMNTDNYISLNYNCIYHDFKYNIKCTNPQHYNLSKTKMKYKVLNSYMNELPKYILNYLPRYKYIFNNCIYNSIYRYSVYHIYITNESNLYFFKECDKQDIDINYFNNNIDIFMIIYKSILINQLCIYINNRKKICNKSTNGLYCNIHKYKYTYYDIKNLIYKSQFYVKIVNENENPSFFVYNKKMYKNDLIK